MEKIPSTMIVNKRMDSVDTRLAALEKPLVHNPLEQALGFYQYGRYVQAPSEADFAFDRVEDLWDIDLASDSESESENEPNDQTVPMEEEGVSKEQEDGTPRQSGHQEQHQQEMATSTTQGTTNNPTKCDEDVTPVPKQPSQKPKRKANTDPTGAARRSAKSKKIDDYHEFYSQIQQSKDKLFIIAQHVGDRPRKDWFVVQVDWDETIESEAKSQGIYHVRWYVRHYIDANTKPVSQCRFWPEVHELMENDVLGAMRPMRPSGTMDNKLHKNNWAWYQQKIHLFADHVVGPFDFVTINNKTHHISSTVWDLFRAQADPLQVDLLNLDRVEPLNEWKRSS